VTDWEDRRLLAGVRARQPEACAALVHAHYAGIYRFLLHLTREVALAEDLTQETFRAAWEKIGAFEGRSSLGTWLHRIAYGKFVDARRADRRAAALVEHLKAQALPAPVDPLETAMAGDEAQHLYATLQRLAPEEQAVLVLHYLQELSYRDMADVLGEPSGTIKWRTCQALSRLRSLLAVEGQHHAH
jgi:RNA polymerase sigma-70 factor (ECF subfamily)